jgi:protein tyrosine/serine phosphatase
MRRSVFSLRLINAVAAFTFVCALSLSAFADTHNKNYAGVSIDNFGQVNDHIYRGAQPKDEQYEELAALGIKTVVDLRGDAKKDSRASAERAELRYINLPLGDKSYPQADAAARFLEIVNNPGNGIVYVHCAGGRHRTGAMVAVYRMEVDHWTIAQAYDEMKQYDFYTSGGHGCYKDYVYDHYNTLQAKLNPQASASALVKALR